MNFYHEVKLRKRFSGHFSALVPSEPISINSNREEEDVTYLPLMSCDKKLIPIHFITQTEVNFAWKNQNEFLTIFDPFQARTRRKNHEKLAGCLLHRGRVNGKFCKTIDFIHEQISRRLHVKSITKDRCW